MQNQKKTKKGLVKATRYTEHKSKSESCMTGQCVVGTEKSCVTGQCVVGTEKSCMTGQCVVGTEESRLLCWNDTMEDVRLFWD